MIRKVSTILLSIIATLVVILTICSSNMSQMRMDCPDAHGVKISAFHEQPFSCFSLHMTGIQLFDQAMGSPQILLIIASTFGLWYLTSIVVDILLQKGLLVSLVEIHSPFASRKKYRCFAKQYSIY